MDDPTRTTTKLLDGLHDRSNHEVWTAFDTRFRPVILGVARRMGLGPEDARDAAQEIVLEFVQAYRAGKYEREKGSLRAWILGIARHRVIDAMRRRDDLRGARGESVLSLLPEDDDMEELWNEEWRRKVLADAYRTLMRGSDFDERTLNAFRMYAIEERPAKEVADQLGLSIGSVYMAKHRCAQRLRELEGELVRAYELVG